MDWVQKTVSLPLVFAQVREDSLLDLKVVKQFGGSGRLLMVASGGCTAAYLAASGRVSSLHIADPNPAQIALSQLKVRLLTEASTEERLSLLGHSLMEPKKRIKLLKAIAQELGWSIQILGPENLIAKLGPDHVGRYEMVFSQLREALKDHQLQIQKLLHLNVPAKQVRLIVPTSALGSALDASFRNVMSLPNLVALFGKSATANRVESFAKHFTKRIRHVLSILPALENPYLGQLLLGRFQEKWRYPWFDSPMVRDLPRIKWSNKFMQEVLRNAKPDSYNVAHLSNILDWLSPAEAGEILNFTWRALNKGGVVFVRQLNSKLRIPQANQKFEWLTDVAAQLHREDRSFFYRALHLGIKQ